MARASQVPWNEASAATRAGGALLICGGIVLGIAFILVALAPIGPASVTPLVGVTLLLATALLLAGLPAHFTVQAKETGTAGAVAHGLLTIGLLLLVVVSATPVLHPDADLLPGDSPVLFLLAVALAAGLILTAVVTLRARVLPRAPAIGLLAGAVCFAFAFFVAELVTPLAGQVGTALAGVLLGASFAWLGRAVWIAS